MHVGMAAVFQESTEGAERSRGVHRAARGRWSIDRFHLSCSWANMTDTAVAFPREMCVGSGFVLEGMPQSVCDAH